MPALRLALPLVLFPLVAPSAFAAEGARALCAGTPGTAERRTCVANAQALFTAASALPDLDLMKPTFDVVQGALAREQVALSDFEALDSFRAHYGTCDGAADSATCQELGVEVHLSVEPFAVGLMGVDLDQTVKRDPQVIITRGDSVDPDRAELQVALGDVADDEAGLERLKAIHRPGPRAVWILVDGSKKLVEAFGAKFRADRVLKTLAATKVDAQRPSKAPAGGPR